MSSKMYISEGTPNRFWVGRSNVYNPPQASYYSAFPSYQNGNNSNSHNSNLIGHVTGQCPVGPLASGRFTSR